jgi:hypothetical protein
VSEAVYEPGPNDSDNDRAVDIDQAFGENGVDELIDRSYSPPEKPLELDKFGTTLAEQRQGESFEQRLAQEEPDPNASLVLDEGPRSERSGEQTPVPDDIDAGGADPLAYETPDDEAWDGVLDDGEVGDARAGRLVDPDEGLSADIDSDLVGYDVGIDAGAASAEEAAVHIIGETEADRAIERDRREKPAL